MAEWRLSSNAVISIADALITRGLTVRDAVLSVPSKRPLTVRLAVNYALAGLQYRSVGAIGLLVQDTIVSMYHGISFAYRLLRHRADCPIKMRALGTLWLIASHTAQPVQPETIGARWGRVRGLVAKPVDGRPAIRAFLSLGLDAAELAIPAHARGTATRTAAGIGRKLGTTSTFR